LQHALHPHEVDEESQSALHEPPTQICPQPHAGEQLFAWHCLSTGEHVCPPLQMPMHLPPQP